MIILGVSDANCHMVPYLDIWDPLKTTAGRCKSGHLLVLQEPHPDSQSLALGSHGHMASVADSLYFGGLDRLQRGKYGKGIRSDCRGAGWIDPCKVRTRVKREGGSNLRDGAGVSVSEGQTH